MFRRHFRSTSASCVAQSNRLSTRYGMAACLAILSALAGPASVACAEAKERPTSLIGRLDLGLGTLMGESRFAGGASVDLTTWGRGSPGLALLVRRGGVGIFSDHLTTTSLQPGVAWALGRGKWWLLSTRLTGGLGFYEYQSGSDGICWYEPCRRDDDSASEQGVEFLVGGDLGVLLHASILAFDLRLRLEAGTAGHLSATAGLGVGAAF